MEDIPIWSYPIIVLGAIMFLGLVLRSAGAVIKVLTPIMIIFCVAAVIFLVFRGC